jgi:hypothetical protein
MRRRQEDLHGYDVMTAIDFAVTRAEEGWANGYDEIEFLHGAANVQEPVEDGRGRIKWGLRELLDSGRLDRWVNRERSWPKAGSLVVALRRNPRPRPERWSAAPSRAHGRGRGRPLAPY